MAPRGIWILLLVSLSPLLEATAFAVGLATKEVDVDWGSVGEWAGAVGSFAAVAVALWIAISDARRRETDRKDAEAALARLITVRTKQGGLGGFLHVTVANHSSSPVFAVRIDDVHASPAPPGAVQLRHIGGNRAWDRIDPGKAVTSSFKVLDETNRMIIFGDHVSLAADVSFVDSSGLRWRRWGNTPPRRGAPIRIQRPPAPFATIVDRNQLPTSAETSP